MVLDVRGSVALQCVVRLEDKTRHATMIIFAVLTLVMGRYFDFENPTLTR